MSPFKKNGNNTYEVKPWYFFLTNVIMPIITVISVLIAVYAHTALNPIRKDISYNTSEIYKVAELAKKNNEKLHEIDKQVGINTTAIADLKTR